MGLFLLLGFAAAVTNEVTLQSVTWLEFPGQECDHHKLRVQFFDDDGTTRCPDGSSPRGIDECEGDGMTVDACKNQCEAMDFCYGVSYRSIDSSPSGAKICSFHTSACNVYSSQGSIEGLSAIDGATGTYYVKSNPEGRRCAMRWGLEFLWVDGDFVGSEHCGGSYYMADSINGTFQHIDQNCTVKWQDCQWLLQTNDETLSFHNPIYDACDDTYAPDWDLLKLASQPHNLYNHKSLEDSLPEMQIEKVCDTLQDVYTTHSGKYCDQTNHLPPKGNPTISEDMDVNRCHTKCAYRHISGRKPLPVGAVVMIKSTGEIATISSSPDGIYWDGSGFQGPDVVVELPNGVSTTIGVAQINDFCGGHEPAITGIKTNMALCLPREQCEVACDNDADCAGIDMHSSVSRCYLNDHTCVDNVGQYDATTNQSRMIDDQKWNFLVRSSAFVKYDTFSNQYAAPCTTGTVRGTISREVAEGECTADAKCRGLLFNRASKEFTMCIPAGIFDPYSPQEGAYDEGFDMILKRVVNTYDLSSYNLGPSGDDVANNMRITKRCHFRVGEDAVRRRSLSVSDYGIRFTSGIGNVLDAEVIPPTGARTYEFHPTCTATYEGGSGTVVCYNSDNTGVLRRLVRAKDNLRYEPNRPYRTDLWGSEKLILEQFVDTISDWVPIAITSDGGRAVARSPAPSFTDPEAWMGYQDAYDGMTMFFPSTATADISYICDSYNECATYSVCVLGTHRYNDEKLALESDFRPVVISTVGEAVGYINGTTFSSWTFGDPEDQYGSGSVDARERHGYPTIYRAERQTVVEVISLGDTDMLRVTLTPVEVSRPVPSGYQNYVMDQIKVEQIDQSGAVDIQLRILVPNGYERDNLQMFEVTPSSTDPYGQTIAPSMEPNGKMYWIFKAENTGVFTGAIEQSCTEPVLDQSSRFRSISGAGVRGGVERQIVCKHGYNQNHSTLQCSQGTWKLYNAIGSSVWTAPDFANHDFQAFVCEQAYISTPTVYRWSFVSRMDYPLRIQSIEAFSDCSCTSSVAVQIDHAMPSYDNAHGQQEMLGGGVFWSKSLVLNPTDVDETNSPGNYIDFRVAKDIDVQCVKVSFPRGGTHEYYPQVMKLSRGATDQDGNFGYGSILEAEGWTSEWTLDLGAARDDERCDSSSWREETQQNLQGKSTSVMVARFGTISGEAGNVMGELIDWRVKYSEEAGYDNDLEETELPEVHSACHCKQLCIDQAHNGCLFWKFEEFGPDGARSASDPRGLCYLMKNAYTESCADGVNTRWGGIGTRISGFSPSVVQSMELFDLTISGYNLNMDWQRVRIVRNDWQALAGHSCTEKDETTEYVSGIQCSDNLICNPGPSRKSATEVSWSNIRISGGQDDSTYSVCYNHGDQTNVNDWYAVPGTISHFESAAEYKFEVVSPTPMSYEKPVVPRTASSITLTVHGPEPAALKRYKLVRDAYDCDVASDPRVLIEDMLPDMSLQERLQGYTTQSETITVDCMHTFGDGSWGCAVGTYKVCVQLVTETSWHHVPSFGGYTTLEIEADDNWDLTPRQVYGGQRFSGSSRESVEVALRGHRLQAPEYGWLNAVPAGRSCDWADHSDVFQASYMGSRDGAYTYSWSSLNATTYDLCYCGRKKYTSVQYHVIRDNLVASLAPEHDNLKCVEKCATGCSAEDQATLEYLSDNHPSLVSYAYCMSANDAERLNFGQSYPAFSCLRDLKACIFEEPAVRRASSERERKLLSPPDTSPVVNEAWDTFDGRQKATCSAQEYHKIGTLDTSANPDFGQAWVLSADKPQAIEVVGEGLNHTVSRVMLISGDGTCAVSGPTSLTNWTMQDYSSWLTSNIDRDWRAPPNESWFEHTYDLDANWYCPGGNFIPRDLANATLNPAGIRISEWCHEHVGELGWHQDDDEFSGAICADVARLQYLCSQLPDCHGFEYKDDGNRGFLNKKTHCHDDESWMYESDYTFHVKNDDQTVHTNQPLQPIDDDSLLRFEGIEFQATGTAKVCFCDTHCSKKEGYKFELGKVHVSAISCLMQQHEQFRRDVCFQQGANEDQGLRCPPRRELQPNIDELTCAVLNAGAQRWVSPRMTRRVWTPPSTLALPPALQKRPPSNIIFEIRTTFSSGTYTACNYVYSSSPSRIAFGSDAAACCHGPSNKLGVCVPHTSRSWAKCTPAANAQQSRRLFPVAYSLSSKDREERRARRRLERRARRATTARQNP